jgi:hypothetical protein
MAIRSRSYFNSIFLSIDSAPIRLHLALPNVVSTIYKGYIVNTDSVSRTYTLWVVAAGGADPVAVDSRTIKNTIPISANDNDESLGPIVLEPGMSLWGGASVKDVIAITGQGYDRSV